jgi:hypothetical protein
VTWKSTPAVGTLTITIPTSAWRLKSLVNDRGKLFYFGNYFDANGAIPGGKPRGTLTIPANDKHLQGDFSDLLALPNAAQ